MKTFGMALDLKDNNVVENYERYHQEVWPEVEKGLKSVGIVSMRIFRIGCRLFMCLETVDDFDPQIDFPKYLDTSPRCREWDTLMQTFQQKLPEAGEDEWWALMKEVYHLS